MKNIISFFGTILLLLLVFFAHGQPVTYPYKVAQERMLWHDNIDKEQKRLVSAHGNPRDTVQIRKDEQLNIQIADALIRQVDELQKQIELDSTLSGQLKIKYLRALETMIKGFNNDAGKKNFPFSIASGLPIAFKKAMLLDRNNQSIEPVVQENAYGIGAILVDCFLLPSENQGVKASRVLLKMRYCEMHPDEIFSFLSSNPDFVYADSLIIIAGHRQIRKLYDLAQAHNLLAGRIHMSRDSLIATVARMADSRSGQLYFPFLDDLIKGRITISDINKVKDDGLNYYRLLVKTRLGYAARLLPPMRDTALEMDALTKMLANKGKDIFIREINALHTVSNPIIRFKILDPLTPEELYYLIVLSEDEIYTSSYLGVYDRIFNKMKTPKGDSLIMQVSGDYFRKFIKMAAAYNKLDHFLATMDKGNDGTVMKAFIIGLEKAKEEDAVDVADSYSSIFEKNPFLAKYVLSEVKLNYKKNLLHDNRKGTIIYNLLQTLFESADTTTKVNLSEKLGIGSIYTIDYDSLKDDSGRVIEQVFFYGDQDKDGQLSYADYMALFIRKPEWKITESPNKEWVWISSIKGKPVWIFANKPLLGEDDPDDKAQHDLDDYLFDNKWKPTIYIHRGHSYHVSSTLKQLEASAKIVVLGSCGGYNNLSEVLKISEDAHIISSKQVGTKAVNEPILQAINNNLLQGKNIEWLNIWKDLGDHFEKDPAAKEKFDDYIPPYKNLGAIFIKAYRKAMGEDE